MISDVKILNGELELKFNEYTYEYTVKVDKDVNKLEFEYTINEGTSVEIRNNYIDEENNIVYLDVYDVNNTITYAFYVYKENTNMSLGIDNYKKSLEVTVVDKYYEYKVMGLIAGCFFMIILVFSILFRRKKKM